MGEETEQIEAPEEHRRAARRVNPGRRPEDQPKPTKLFEQFAELSLLKKLVALVGAAGATVMFGIPTAIDLFEDRKEERRISALIIGNRVRDVQILEDELKRCRDQVESLRKGSK